MRDRLPGKLLLIRPMMKSYIFLWIGILKHHVSDAIAAGHSDVCTIERDGAEERREESLAGISAKTGYDRDEWPMAMCEEGGAGAWVGNQLEDYPDGTRVLFNTD
ncbi:hypothetical protein QFZ72_003958 [Bacillus sp. V2I10]|nr:hypothetical protein [Bacillus sp. V2I10]